MPPRTVIFGGKAAPGYFMAKLIIKLDPTPWPRWSMPTRRPADRLRWSSSPTTTSRTASRSIPAADLSEQISTAGKEASGTGNMKFAMNGALTIGTLDGANVEIREEVGAENFFLFGLTARRWSVRRARGYRPVAGYYRERPGAGRCDRRPCADGTFVAGDQWLLRDVYAALMERGDYYMHLTADFRAPTSNAQARVARLFRRSPGVGQRWRSRNVANMGFFSSDRAIREYAEKVWRVEPVPIPRRARRGSGLETGCQSGSELGRRRPVTKEKKRMSRSKALRIAASLALGAALVVPMAASTALAKDESTLRLRAFAVDLNNRARTNTLDIVIERWSSPEEAANFKAVLVEKGEDKLLSALQRTRPRCGFVRTSTSLGWDIFFARETPLPDGGRKIVLASDRPVAMWEARNAGRSMDYQFSLAEIRLPKEGKGQGKAIPYAQLTFNKDTNTARDRELPARAGAPQRSLRRVELAIAPMKGAHL